MVCFGETILFNSNIHLYSRIGLSIFISFSLIMDGDIILKFNDISSMGESSVLIILIGVFVVLSMCSGIACLVLMVTEHLQHRVLGPRSCFVAARNHLHSRCTIVVVTLWSVIHLLQLGFSFILSIYSRTHEKYVYAPGAELFKSIGDNSDGVVAAMGIEIIVVSSVLASFFTWLASREVLEEDYSPLVQPEDDPPPPYPGISLIQPDEPYLPKYDDIYPMEPIGNI